MGALFARATVRRVFAYAANVFWVSAPVAAALVDLVLLLKAQERSKRRSGTSALTRVRISPHRGIKPI